ncbi:MAG: PD40 domain-containing protein [Flavobacteriales bacterium]|nr:PD40 domain-containing protein [Flavobacteriales bacterium]MCB9447614.1 PD40 domain-containing protein [Flavobacteriales bacterium]
MRNILLVIVCSLFCAGAFAQDTDSTWYRYPAVSPDGSTIAFCHGGDIYTVPVAGGVARVLTLHEAHDFMPVWSPDGKTIAFASDRYGNYDVFTIPASGGKPTRLTYYSSNDLPSDFTPEGDKVLFSSRRTDDPGSSQFPSWGFPQLYEVPVAGGMPVMILTTPALNARYHKSGKMILYDDLKGVEDLWRKHQTSSVAHDIWVLDVENKRHRQLTTYEGEDRNAVWAPNEQEIFYLSEKSGSFNVWKFPLLDPSQVTQVTNHKNHPVRNLSIASNGLMCYSYHGSIYTVRDGEQPVKVSIQVRNDGRDLERKFEPLGSEVSEMDVSPDGKEIAFINRGEVFVTSVDHRITKRITNTPEMERSVSFSPDGKSLLYAAERNGSWNIYQTKMVREDEKYFYQATVLKETPLVEGPEEAFQPQWAPDGKEIAYLEERTTLKILTLATRRTRVAMSGDHTYSYIDGDQYFQWSPDGKWLLVSFFDRERWDGEVGLVSAAGDGKVVNLTNSGYNDYHPKWILDGKAMIWYTDRNGNFRHSGSGSEDDVEAMYFTREAFDRANLSEVEWELLKEEEKDHKKSEGGYVPPIKIDLNGIERRTKQLTPHASWLADAVVSDDGGTLYYMAKSDNEGYDIWSRNLYKDEIKSLANVGGMGTLTLSKDGKTLFVISDDKMYTVETSGGKKSAISFSAEMEVDEAAERKYFLEHMWRQALKKFYKVDMQGVDWAFYLKEYERVLPDVNNLRDFSELASEMLGELNASHTGAKYRGKTPEGSDETASLGLMYDRGYVGAGLKVSEVLPGGPLDLAASRVKRGVVIEKIDGEQLTMTNNPYELLNHKSGKYVLLSLYDPASRGRWEERVKATSVGDEGNMLYERWVKGREDETERLSGGRLGYVHVRGMNDKSYREVYDKAMGKYFDKEALVVDTRFNGGGNLHDQLCVFLSGKKYFTTFPRGQVLGIRPDTRWTKPSVVLMCETNYSDAHIFPYAYKELNIGKLIGMPVPGTGTSVWWERLYIGIVFGIPEVGYMGLDGTLLENQELQPDIKVKNEYEQVAVGKDQQLERAVKELLDELGKK